MAAFRGSYMHSIDHKGRISVPARFRKALSGRASATFVIVRGLETCVAIYPQDEWKRMEERLRSRSFYDETNRRFLRTMTRTTPRSTRRGAWPFRRGFSRTPGSRRKRW